MAIEGLTQKQSDFIERFFKIPRVFGRSAKKKQRRAAKEDFRTFNAEHDLIHDEIMQVADDGKRAELLAWLRRAEDVIEADPAALNFAGGHQHLKEVQTAAQAHTKGIEARAAFDTAQKRMNDVQGGTSLETPTGASDAQSDIALTWGFIQDKLEAGEKNADPKEFDAALKAMERLKVMLDQATEAQTNPFDARLAEVGGAKAAAQGMLDTDVMAARHRLRDVFNQHGTLQDLLVTTFGEASIPLELSFGMTATKAKLTQAETAADNELSELADDAEEAFAKVNKSATTLIDQREVWARDEAAFLVRYQVMLSHKLKGSPRVQVAFAEITNTYTACKDLAKGHNYTQACMDLVVVRNNLKDALDLADDYARYALLYASSQAVLGTLPARDSYPLPEMAQQHDDALQLLQDADDARLAKQMTSALTILNTIPKAVEDLLDLNKFAGQYVLAKTKWNKRLTSINSNFTSDVLNLLKEDMEYSKKVGLDAEADAKAGDYRAASSKLIQQWRFVGSVLARAEYIKAYFVDYEAFKKRRREARARKGPEGRVAIEPYYQALKGNEAKRVAAEAVGDFKLARAMCMRRAGDHAEMMRLADDAKDYLAEEATFKAALAQLKTATSADALAAKANAEDMRAYAIAATERGNWRAAANLLQNANLEIKRAVDDVETAKLIDGMQGGSDTVTLSGDTTFKAVYASFAKIHSHASGLDKQGLFTEEFAEADRQARSIETTMVQDPVGAEATLNAAIQTCRELAAKGSAANGYQAQEAAAAALLASAGSANADNIVDTELQHAKAAHDRAKAMAAGADPDFAGAIGHLADAQAAGRMALDAMDSYNRVIKDARVKMQAALTAYQDPACGPYLVAHVAPLQAALDEMNADFLARKIAPAEAQAAKGVALAGHHTVLFAACKKVVDLLHLLEPDKAGPEAAHPLTQNHEQVKKVALVAEMKDALGKGGYERAFKLMCQAYGIMKDAREKVAAYEAYILDELACEEKLTDLEDRTVPEAGPGHDAVLALRATYDAVLEQKALDNYGGAKKRLAGFLPKAREASDLLDVYDRYVLRQKQAREALEKVQKASSPTIETLIARLEGKERNADRKGQAFDFAIGTALYQELETDCINAETTATAVEDLVVMTNDIKAIGDQDLSDLKAAVSKARLALEGMRGQQSSIYVMNDITQTQSDLEAAETQAGTDFDAGRSAVEAVVDDIKALTLTLAQYDQLTEAVAVARELAKTLQARTPEVDLVALEIETRMGQLNVAMKGARQSKDNRPMAQQEVEATISDLRDLRRVVDAQADYLAHRAPLEKALIDLEKSKFRSMVLEDIAEIRKAMDTAATRVVEKRHNDAEAELKKATIRMELAALRTKLANNDTPDPDEVRKILEAPGGIENLDEMVEKLDPSTQRKVLAVAFEARFGCKLELVKKFNEGPTPSVADDMDAPAVNMRKFYDEMSKLPESDTLDNDSLLTFLASSEKATFSAYAPTKKKIVMREGDETKAIIYPIAMEHEIGDIDPDAIPKPGEERTTFSWNTLHEVGHAVDDKLGYMKKHGERLAGWKMYGADVKEAATAIADQYNFDADYVAEYMLSSAGRKMPVPPPEPGCDAEEWHRRMEECRMFVDRARADNKPWSSASVAAACAVGNYTYVESYPGKWARYRTDQRKYAVSGYQFRAPGEWFSELYAAKASDRLNSNHPHHDEFAQICTKESA